MAKSSLAARLIKATNNENISTLSNSSFKTKPDVFKTKVPLVNGMLSGRLDGGVQPGVTIILGDSRTFKTNFGLLNCKGFLDEHPEGVVLFFDCEFGAGKYFKSFDIDEDRVIHIPFTNIEEMKHTVSAMLEEVKPGEKVMVFIDSVSQVASKKEVQDAVDGKEVADMTRAKSLNSFWRIVTPVLTMKGIPLFAINSFYADTTNKYAENIMKGGKQGFLSADTILFVTRSQEKEKDGDKELKGWNFNYTIMKSRSVREKSKFTLTVTYEGGIDVESGLFTMAMDSGIITMPKSGWYLIEPAVAQVVMPSLDTEKQYRKAEISESGFLMKLASNQLFKDAFHKRYAMEAGTMVQEDEDTSLDVLIDPETGEIVDVN